MRPLFWRLGASLILIIGTVTVAYGATLSDLNGLDPSVRTRLGRGLRTLRDAAVTRESRLKMKVDYFLKSKYFGRAIVFYDPAANREGEAIVTRVVEDSDKRYFLAVRNRENTARAKLKVIFEIDYEALLRKGSPSAKSGGLERRQQMQLETVQQVNSMIGPLLSGSGSDFSASGSDLIPPGLSQLGDSGAPEPAELNEADPLVYYLDSSTNEEKKGNVVVINKVISLVDGTPLKVRFERVDG